MENYGIRVSRLSRECYLGHSVKEIHTVPSALEFMRFVAMNKPFVIRNYDSHLTKKWTNEYLIEKMKDSKVKVSITPDGYADAVKVVDGRKVFTLPFDTEMSFEEVLVCVQDRSNRLVYYVQTQNDSMHDDFKALIDDVGGDIAWASEAMDAKPAAVNFWMGCEKSVTSLHKDIFENLYLVVRGTKIFTLYPPTDCLMFPTTKYPAYRYDEEMNLKDEELDYVWYPEEPMHYHPQPFIVHVNEGDLLYLPALYYHFVEQRGDSDGICIAVNYWYDMVFDQKYCWTFAADSNNYVN